MAGFNLGGGLGGALTGAQGGSAFGAPGAIAGGILGGLGGLFGGKRKKKPRKLSTLDPQQKALYNDYVSSLRNEGPFKDLYNFDANAANQNFDQNIARPAYRDFQENIVPQITGQYRQGNQLNSSYAADALAKRGRNVQENLDAQRSNLIFQGQNQANANKQNALNSILGMNTFGYQQRNPNSSIDSILSQAAPAAGEWFNNYLNNSGPSKPTPPSTPNSSFSGYLSNLNSVIGKPLFGGGRYNA